jgi:hypothetical protein
MFASTEKSVKAFNSDLKAATDSVYHEAIEVVIESVQAVMPVKDWYYRLVTKLLASSRPFSMKMEDELIQGSTRRGCFMGDHGAKTVLTVSGMYALAGMNFPRISRLVGDDQVTVSENAEKAGSIYRDRMEQLGYILSEDDTFVSRTVFFAEEATEICRIPGQTTEVWLSRKGKSRLPFVDTPKIKILSDAGKDMGLFSDTSIGKITLLGKRMESTGKTFCEGVFHLASWIQDICISLIYRKEFIYFPRFLVQTGKPMLFGCVENTRSFLRMQRGGRLVRHYADIMLQALRPNDNVRLGKYIVQSFFTHGTNDESIRILERKFEKYDFEGHRVLTSAAIKGYEPFFVHRLASKLITESEIVSKLAERELLLGTPAATKRLTVQNLSRGGEELTDELLTEFMEAWSVDSKILRIRREEKYYDRKAVEDMLEFKHPLRVAGLLEDLPLIEECDMLRTERDREVTQLYEWVMSNPQRLDDIPRALIRDDPVLILADQYLTITKLLIVSNDMKLVNYCANARGLNWRARRETYHISVIDWVLSDLTAGRWFNTATEVFVDGGSLDGWLDHMDSVNREIPDPDGKTILGRFRLLKVRGDWKLPREVMEIIHLRGEMPSVSE